MPGATNDRKTDPTLEQARKEGRIPAFRKNLGHLSKSSDEGTSQPLGAKAMMDAGDSEPDIEIIKKLDCNAPHGKRNVTNNENDSNFAPFEMQDTHSFVEDMTEPTMSWH